MNWFVRLTRLLHCNGWEALRHLNFDFAQVDNGSLSHGAVAEVGAEMEIVGVTEPSFEALIQEVWHGQ